MIKIMFHQPSAIYRTKAELNFEEIDDSELEQVVTELQGDGYQIDGWVESQGVARSSRTKGGEVAPAELE